MIRKNMIVGLLFSVAISGSLYSAENRFQLAVANAGSLLKNAKDDALQKLKRTGKWCKENPGKVGAVGGLSIIALTFYEINRADLAKQYNLRLRQHLIQRRMAELKKREQRETLLRAAVEVPLLPPRISRSASWPVLN